MRLVEVVRPYLGDLARVVDATDGDPTLGYLPLPPHVQFVDLTGVGTAFCGSGDLLVGIVDYGENSANVLAHLRRCLALIGKGGLGLFVVRGKSRPKDWLAALHATGSAFDCQLINVAGLDYDPFSCAVLFEGAVPAVPQTFPPKVPLDIGVLHALDLADIAKKGQKKLRSGVRMAPMHPSLARQRQTIARLRRRLSHLESSQKLMLGEAVYDLAQRPYRIPRFISTTYRLWKGAREEAQRKRPNTDGAEPGRVEGHIKAVGATAVSDTPTAQSTDTVSRPQLDGSHFLAGTSFVPTPRRRLAVAAIADEHVAFVLRAHTDLSLLAPHDACVLLDRISPDVLLVQSGALINHTPWAHTTTPGGSPNYLSILNQVVSIARQKGVRSVLWYDTRRSASPLLSRMHRHFDRVLDGTRAQEDEVWSPGVPLRHANPIALPRVRSSLPVAIASRQIPVPLDARLMQEHIFQAFRADVLPFGMLGPERLIEEYRSREMVLALPFSTSQAESPLIDTLLMPIACGAKLITGPNDALLTAFPEQVTSVDNLETLVVALRKDEKIAHTSPRVLRRSLRTIYTEHATPVQLERLTRLLHVSDPAMLDPRAVSLLMKPHDSGDLGDMLDDALGQDHRPSCLVIAADTVPGRALSEADALGIETRVVDPKATFPEMAETVTTDWVALWDGKERQARPGRCWLTDLAIAAEASNADAVGYLPPASGSDRDYVFSHNLREGAAIVKRNLVLSATRSELHLPDLVQRGSRLFGIISQEELL